MKFETPKIILFIIAILMTAKCISQPSYIKKFQPLVDSLSESYKIPKSIIMGISIVESGMGKDRNAILLNNYFGYKGENNLSKTHNIKTRYKQYKNAEDSFIDFCNLITRRKYYDRLKGNENYKLWVTAIAKSGYSNNARKWKKDVILIIKKYKLLDF